MEYIARFRESDYKTQLLRDHIYGVANYAKRYGKLIGLEKTCLLAAMLHDAGKYAPEWQSYIRSQMETSSGQDKAPSDRLDHANAGAVWLWGKDRSGDIREILIMAIMYHHGGMEDFVNLTPESPVYNRLARADQNRSTASMKALFADCIPEKDLLDLLQEAVEECSALCKKIQEKKLMFREFDKGHAIHFVIKVIYSIIIDADRQDAADFHNDISHQEDVVLSSKLDDWIEKLESKLDGFKRYDSMTETERIILETRQKVSEACDQAASREKAIYTLTVPTGGGKTLSSLRFALKHAKHWECLDEPFERIIYVLPYTTIIEQTAQVFRETLECGEDLLEHHSSVVFHDEEDESRFKLAAERWDKPIIVTTVVQFLNAVYASGSQPIRRLHRLTRSIIVIDEVQALPLPTIYLFNGAVNALNMLLGSTIVLCTATQPRLQHVKFPALLKLQDSEIVPDQEKLNKKMQRVKIIDQTRSSKWNAEQLSSLCIKEAELTSSVLLIMNTKKGVRELVEAILAVGHSDITVVALTTNLCPAHRKHRIECLKEALQEKTKVICVSTNLIECGVDISFGTVIRNMAGLPSVIQSAGRCNRHGEAAQAEVIITDYLESIDRLFEVRAGYECMSNLMFSFRENSELFSNDLLSYESLEEYYKRYYSKTDVSNTMYYLLHRNNKKGALRPDGKKQANLTHSMYRYLSAPPSEMLSGNWKKILRLAYPLRSMARMFEVIDEDSVSVLVPYNVTGRMIIAEILSLVKDYYLDKAKAVALLRQAQQYTVNLYKHECEQGVKRGDILLVPCFDNLYIAQEGTYGDFLGFGEATPLEAVIF